MVRTIGIARDWRLSTAPFFYASILAFLLAACREGALSAHEMPISFVTLQAGPEYLHLELVINAAELTAFAEIDANRNRRIEQDEIDALGPDLARRVVDCLTLRVNDRPVSAEVAGIVPDPDTHHLTFRAHYPCDARDAAIDLQSGLASTTFGSHVTEVSLETRQGRKSGRLDIRSPSLHFPGPEALPASGAPLPKDRSRSGLPLWPVRRAVWFATGLAAATVLLFFWGRISWRESS